MRLPISPARAVEPAGPGAGRNPESTERSLSMMGYTTGPPPRAGPAVRMGDYPQFSWRTIRQTSPASRSRAANPMPRQVTGTCISAAPGHPGWRSHRRPPRRLDPGPTCCRSARAERTDDHAAVPDEGIHVHQPIVVCPASRIAGYRRELSGSGEARARPHMRGPGTIPGNGGRSRIRTWEGVADGFTGSPSLPIGMPVDLRILHSSPRESRVLSVWRP
jgi:hypothetical protein